MGPLDARICLRALGRLSGAAVRPRRDLPPPPRLPCSSPPPALMPTPHTTICGTGSCHSERRRSSSRRRLPTQLSTAFGDSSFPRPRRRSNSMRRSSSSPRPTRPARSARSLAPACAGPRKASASTRWRSPTAAPSPTGRRSNPCSGRRASPSTCTRARLSQSGRLADALSHSRPARGRRSTAQGHRLPSRPPVFPMQPASATTDPRSPAGIGSRGRPGSSRDSPSGAAASAPTSSGWPPAIANGSGPTSLGPRAYSPSSRTWPRCSRISPTSRPWSEHLDYLRRAIRRLHQGLRPIFDAIEGLSRFDALGEVVSAQRFRDTVRGAIENLRSDEVLNRRQGHSDCAASPSSTRTRSATSAFARSRSSVWSSARSRPRRDPTRCCLIQSA